MNIELLCLLARTNDFMKSFFRPIFLKTLFLTTLLYYLYLDTKWKQHGITVAGGNGYGNQVNQLAHPYGIQIDDYKTFYIADNYNHYIVEWKLNAKHGQILAGGNGTWGTK